MTGSGQLRTILLIFHLGWSVYNAAETTELGEMSSTDTWHPGQSSAGFTQPKDALEHCCPRHEIWKNNTAPPLYIRLLCPRLFLFIFLISSNITRHDICIVFLFLFFPLPDVWIVLLDTSKHKMQDCSLTSACSLFYRVSTVQLSSWARNKKSILARQEQLPDFRCTAALVATEGKCQNREGTRSMKTGGIKLSLQNLILNWQTEKQWVDVGFFSIRTQTNCLLHCSFPFYASEQTVLAC